MSFRSCFVDPVANSVTLVVCDGTTVVLTKADLQTVYQNASGSAAAKRKAVQDWVKAQFGSSAVNVDFDKLFIDPFEWSDALGQCTVRYEP